MLGAIFTLASLVGLIFGFSLLFLPTLMARSRNHPHTFAIFLVNLLFGWTLVGWAVALLWAYAQPAQRQIYRRAAYPAMQVTPQRPLVSAPVGTILPPSASYGGRR